jgi:hypothetical protein
LTESTEKLDALFVNLILMFKTAAMQQMGKIMNPLTGKVERSLDQARFSIDMIEMLKEKTKGNVPAELEKLADSTLVELRMNYVEEAEAGEKADTGGDQGPEEAGTEGDAEAQAGPQGGPSAGAGEKGQDEPAQASAEASDAGAGSADKPGGQ